MSAARFSLSANGRALEPLLSGWPTPSGGSWRPATYTDPITGKKHLGHACEQAGQLADTKYPGTTTRRGRGFRFANGEVADVAAIAVAWMEPGE